MMRSAAAARGASVVMGLPSAANADAAANQPFAMYCPPLMVSTAPVMKAAASEAR